MNQETKTYDIYKRVARLNKIPEGFHFNEARVWAGIQANLEKERISKHTRWVIIFWAIVITVSIALIIMVRFSIQSDNVAPGNGKPAKSNVINDSIKYDSI